MTEIRKIDGRYWGFGHVRVHTEKKVLQYLEMIRLPCFLPTLQKAKICHSRKVISEIPMIPGYIFLCSDEKERENLMRIKKYFVHIELLRTEKEEELFIKDLNILAKCEQLARQEPILINPEIVKGDEVLVTSGTLAGLKTTVIKRDDNMNSIIINLTILNKHVEYPISADKLKKIIY